MLVEQHDGRRRVQYGAQQTPLAVVQKIAPTCGSTDYCI